MTLAGIVAKSIEPSTSASVAVVLFDQLSSPVVARAVAIWQEQRQGDALPLREALFPRAFRFCLDHLSLLRRLADGDYEFRIVGSAHVRAYGTSFEGRHLSDVIAVAPSYGRVLRASLEKAIVGRAPILYRGIIARPDVHFVGFETAFLPAQDLSGGEYVLNVSSYAMKEARDTLR